MNNGLLKINVLIFVSLTFLLTGCSKISEWRNQAATIAELRGINSQLEDEKSQLEMRLSVAQEGVNDELEEYRSMVEEQELVIEKQREKIMALENNVSYLEDELQTFSASEDAMADREEQARSIMNLFSR